MGLIFFLGNVSKKGLKWTNNSNEILSLEPSPEICSTNEELGGKKCLRMGEKKDFYALYYFSEALKILLSKAETKRPTFFSWISFNLKVELLLKEILVKSAAMSRCIFEICSL